MGKNESKHKWLNAFQHGKFLSTTRITLDVFWHIVLFFMIVGLAAMFFFGGLGLGYFVSLAEDIQVEDKEEMARHIYNYEETSHVYFRNNVLLGELPSELHRQEVTLDDVSQHLIDAVIAVEDEYFWEHEGIVPKAIMRALFQEFTNAEVQTGGSTLTQQLIKNQILTNQVSFERKAQEILIALRLENFFEKEEILEAYLNVVPFGRDSSGRNIAGAQAAAQGLFDVDVKDLNVAQAAFIAGLPQSPFAYTPFSNGGELKSEEGLKAGLDRMNTVLNRMLEHGFIDEATYEEAKRYDVIANLTDKKESTFIEYPFLTEEVEKRAVDILMKMMYEADGYSEEDILADRILYDDYRFLARRELRQNGYEIHTTIDKDIYDAFQEVTKEYNHFQPTKYVTRIDPETGEEYQKEMPVEVGASLIENETGAIIAFVGGRDFSRSQVNHATYHVRPNGSTMKPLFGYAPAMELGIIQPGSPLLDVEFTATEMVDKPWSPSNYVSGQERGIESARVALARSDNIPAARLSYEMLRKGVKPHEYLIKMGLNPNVFGEDANVPSMILGPRYMTVEENVAAFTTFANGGVFREPYLIDKIVDRDGNVLFEHEVEEVEVFSPQTAYLTIDMMRDVLSTGTATYARQVLNNPGVDWAAKTGTSQYWHDAWFVATNPNVTIGTWYGYDEYDVDGDFSELQRWELNYMSLNNCSDCSLGYSNRNVGYWAQLVNVAAEINPELITPEKRHESPGGIVSRSYCQISGLLPSEACEKLGLVATDLFNVDYVPTERDNSVINGKYVEIGDVVYEALPSTPDEFVEEGYFLRPEFLQEMGWDDIDDLSRLLPNNDTWSNLKVPESDVPDNDGPPNAPRNLKISGNELTWSEVSDELVIGYRVYMKQFEDDNFELVDSTRDTSLRLRANNHIYTVRAVDLYGNESQDANSVVHGKIENPEPEEDEDDDRRGPGNRGPGRGNDDDPPGRGIRPGEPGDSEEVGGNDKEDEEEEEEQEEDDEEDDEDDDEYNEGQSASLFKRAIALLTQLNRLI